MSFVVVVVLLASWLFIYPSALVRLGLALLCSGAFVQPPF